MAAKISLLKLWNTIMYVVSSVVRMMRATVAKYMPYNSFLSGVISSCCVLPCAVRIWIVLIRACLM